MEGEGQDTEYRDSSDDEMSDSEWDSGSKGPRQRGLFRMRGAPKDSPDDARPVTTPQHLLGLAKVRQVCFHALQDDHGLSNAALPVFFITVEVLQQADKCCRKCG
jgi:hypothetical protein